MIRCEIPLPRTCGPLSECNRRPTILADAAVPAENEIDCLDALATEMIARGWAAHITTPLGRPVRLFVRDPDDAMMCGYIVAAPDASGNWWYWSGWAERIAPAATAGAAAEAITTALRRPADPG